jgi:hypothetical protein
LHNGSRQKSFFFFFQTLKDPAFSIFNNLLWRRARQHLIISLSFYSAFSPVDDHYSSPSIPGICIPIVESTIQEDSIGDRVVEIMILLYRTVFSRCMGSKVTGKQAEISFRSYGILGLVASLRWRFSSPLTGAAFWKPIACRSGGATVEGSAASGDLWMEDGEGEFLKIRIVLNLMRLIVIDRKSLNTVVLYE